MDAGIPVGLPDATSLLSDPRGLAAQLGLDRTSDAQTVARKFEAMFWSMVINQLRTSMTEDGLFAGDRADAYGALFDMFMADYLAEHASLGLARMIERYLERRDQTSPEADQPSNSMQRPAQV